MQAVVRAVLSLSLLVAFTTSAAAALCLQMDHHRTVAMGVSQAVPIAAKHTNPAGAIAAVDDPAGSPSRHACCWQQKSTPEAITPAQRTYPKPASAASAQAKLAPPLNGYVPLGWLDPALEKRDHLTPSLTALSISRT
ncbi:hypothetical protein ARTSIC4J27_3519 [Pseudarthrobacter siccitolerans]|uniref:DUF2946 domain-containing protein n=1 Tax=Pseudarthrobacter siccitolerans TaxID=861266 RepID=A0A024H5V2_9MICC|nr:hypothetical protein [Pseudarthrobacter siccitolerans]CCQ47530.1 hypothetical protein ARTSIC4J27_3519 [Pseudarthrobacter siccitolerans]